MAMEMEIEMGMEMEMGMQRLRFAGWTADRRAG